MTEREHPHDDALLDLVNGLAAPGRRAGVVAHLRACDACAERLHAFAGDHERAWVRLAAAGLGARRAAARPARLARLHVLPWAAALIAAFGLAGTLYLRRPPAAPDRVPRLPEPELAGPTRDLGGVPADPAIAAGLDAWRRGDALAAARLLTSARGQGAWEDVRRLYLGSARLELGDARAAVEALEPLDMERLPEPWRGEGRAALAAAYAASGQAARADALWRGLSSRDDAIGERARRALAR